MCLNSCSMRQPELIADLFGPPPACAQLADGAVLLRGFAAGEAPVLVRSIETVAASAPFGRLETPGGFRMSVAMTNCGPLGWISDRKCYRYEEEAPETG